MKTFWKNGFEIDFENKNRWTALLALPIVVWFIYHLNYGMNEFQQNKDWLKYKTTENLNGVVAKKGIDSSNRNTPFIKLKYQTFYHEDKEIWQYIEVGDSLSSPRNSPILEIHKKDTILKIDYRNLYWKQDSIIKAN